MKYTNNKNNISEIFKVLIINSVTKSYILNIKIRPLVTEYALGFNEWAEQVPHTSLIVNAYSVTSGLILIFKMYDLVILFII